jgi:hypothetical protein
LLKEDQIKILRKIRQTRERKKISNPANLQLKSLLAEIESKTQKGFTTGSPPLKDLY